MRKPSIPDLIYQRTFPKPKPTDPASFYAHVHRNIVVEIRAEVQTYYGTVDTLEAQYPGLDYTHPPHRRRLSRFTWHRRLFRVFDELGVTKDEILSLCKWEGTRAAKERYEQDAETKVKTTTGDDVAAAPVGLGPRAVFEQPSRPVCDYQSEDAETVAAEADREDLDRPKTDPSTVSQSPEPTNVVLEALRDVMFARLEGDPSADNHALEQWLKEALERHEMDLESAIQFIRSVEAESTSISISTNTGDNTNEPEEVDGEQIPPVPRISSGQAEPPQQPNNSSWAGPPVRLPPLAEDPDYAPSLQSNSTRRAADYGAALLYLRRTRPEAAR
ncbi:hypothetical protein A1O1_00860 [Capronia coronata CBS 617.96]|uniref:Uncharacterized protein n=1 Tax=Capronia coronata CBS 617.96 TaxID=1182541 RepID=W9Z2D1_9EURO|nr:uncharacterized protein A1O1_00860 [Capronia coronata CBS 617.96]EXJ95736.1 hypothetical protein A1O1_00860 [Capronia coronata CBS 617.96]